MLKIIDGHEIEMTPKEIAEFEAMQVAITQQAAAAIVGAVTQAQAKIALSRAGLLDQVKAVVAAYPEEVQIWFDCAGVWERSNPYIAGIAMELSLGDDRIDTLFADAAKL